MAPHFDRLLLLSFVYTQLLEKSIASFFTPTSQKDPHELNWSVVNRTLLVGRYNPHVAKAGQASDPLATNSKRRNIAAFDLVCAHYTHSLFYTFLRNTSAYF